MTKKILVIYFTQSGQLQQIADKFSIPFLKDNMDVEVIPILPKNNFPFPWTSDSFFDAMPESVLGIPVEIEPFAIKQSKYDLVVFAYQPWYLSPSIPASSILQHPLFINVLKDTPVITIIGARNMWINAQEKVKKTLAGAGAKLVGNIVLVDKHSNLVSVVTILHWMMTGRKSRFLGVFPTPGISNEDISNATVYGEIAKKHLETNNFDHLQTSLVAEKAVEVKTNLMFIESRAGKLFSIWANTIIKKNNRKTWLKIFKYYLLVALFIVAPIVLTIYNLIFRPFLGRSIQKKKQYFAGVK